MGAGVHHAVAGVGMRQVIAGLPAVKGKLHDLHAGVATLCQHGLDLRGQVAQVLGNDAAFTQSFVHGVDKITVRALFPVAARCGLVSGGDGVVALKTAEMVDAHHIVNGGGVLHPAFPPGKAGGFVRGPVIQGVAPQLAVCCKGVRRASGHLGQMHFSVGLEQLRVGPQVTGIRADIDGNIAHQADALAVGVSLQGVPLGVEEELHRLVVIHRTGETLFCGSNGFRFAAAQVIRPVGKACLPLFGLDSHEQGVILQPEALRLAEGFIGGGGGCQQAVGCLFQDHRPLVVQCAVVDGAYRPYGGNFIGRQQTDVGQQAVVNEVGVAGKGGKALVRAVTVAGGADGQNLPVGLFCLGEEIDKCEGLFAQRADAKGPRQAEHGHQNAACTHGAHLLSP